MKKAFQNLIRNYFNFTKGERNAFIILFTVTLIIAIYPLIGFKSRHAEQTDFSLIEQLESNTYRDTQEQVKSNIAEDFQEYPEGKTYSRKFLFDPNTASIAELESLGFEKYLAVRIVKFRNAGGKFYIKSDIGKIYGITPEFVEELLPYIELPETKTPNFIKDNPAVQAKKSYRLELIDVNIADTLTLNKLRGIGNKLSMRIVSFRDKLGGFYSLEQLSEVYGLKPEVIEEIKPRLRQDITPFRLLDINKATLEELSSHPYIKKNLAVVIVNYRTQHGEYNSVNDLLNTKVLDEMLFKKLKNYLKI